MAKKKMVVQKTNGWFVCMALACAVVSASAAEYYVAPGATGSYAAGNPGPDPVQAAKLATQAGDVIHVAAGTYETTKTISLQAGVKLLGAGPDVTHIHAAIAVTNGSTNTRVAYVYGSGVEIRDLTLSGGYTAYQGGGICCANYVTYSVSNCVIERCSAKYQGGGVMGGTLRDCLVRNCRVFGTGNSGEGGATDSYPPNKYERTGGGVFGGTYHNCTIVSNAAVYGGGGIGGSGGTAEYDKLDRNLTRTWVARAYNCTIAYNTAEHGAGAFGGAEGSVYLTDCLIASNTANATKWSMGGGVCRGILSNCVVRANQCRAVGGGLQGGRAVDCDIVGNQLLGPYPGGEDWTGISIGGAGANTSVLVRCSIRDNRSGPVLYGVGCRWCFATNCLFTGNVGVYGGAGFNGVFSGCVISNNTTTMPGAACYNSSTYNCVVTGNTGGYFGVLVRGYHEGDLVYGNTCSSRGAFCCEDGGSDLAAVNCTIVSNRCSNGYNIGFASGYMTNCVVVGHPASDVQNTKALVNSLFVSYAASDEGVQAAVNCKKGVDPKFGASGPGEWPYQLSGGSPARDAALPLAWMADAVDVAGRPRVVHGAPDMGAFEYPGPFGFLMLFR